MGLPDGGQVYGDGSNSSIGSQLRTDFFRRKALITARQEVYFGNLADTTNMPAHYGKTIKQYLYLPLLDDGNINSQGIDANGAVTQKSVSIAITKSDGSIPIIPEANRSADNKVYFVGTGSSNAAAGTAARAKVIAWMEAPTAGGGLGLTLVGSTAPEKFVDGVNKTDGLAYVKGFRFYNALGTELNTSATTTDAGAVPDYGNLYASSKDVGAVANKLPSLGETGGRVHRVGFTRVELEGTLHKFGLIDFCKPHQSESSLWQ